MDYQAGIYQGFLNFEGKKHSVNIPVTFGVKEHVTDNDSLIFVSGQQGDDVIFGNSHYNSSVVCWNFGQDGTFGGTETAQGNADGNGIGNFYYSPPTGYLALCTSNLGS